MSVEKCLFALNLLLYSTTWEGDTPPPSISLDVCYKSDDIPYELKREVLKVSRLLDRWYFDYYELYIRASNTYPILDCIKLLRLYQKLCKYDKRLIANYIENIPKRYEGVSGKKDNHLKTLRSYNIFSEIRNTMNQQISRTALTQLINKFEEQIIIPSNFPSTQLKWETAELEKTAMFIYRELVKLEHAIKRLTELKHILSMTHNRELYKKEITRLEKLIDRTKRNISGEAWRACVILDIPTNTCKSF